MEQKYLLDTNVIIDFMGNRLPLKSKIFIAQLIDTEANLSVINKIELLSFSEISTLLNSFIEQSNILPLHDECQSNHSYSQTI